MYMYVTNFNVLLVKNFSYCHMILLMGTQIVLFPIVYVNYLKTLKQFYSNL